MTETLIRQIAEQIVREELLENWRLYVLVIAIAALSAVATAFSSSYFRRRGETYATRSDFSELLAQLRETTKAAEGVRSEIAHADWKSKEWKTLRRIKLEELMLFMYETRDWIADQGIAKIFGSEPSVLRDQQPILDLTARLYFPELWSDVQACSVTISQMKVMVLEAALAKLNSKNDINLFYTEVEKYKSTWYPAYQTLLKQIGDVEKKAPEVLRSIMDA